VPHGKTHTNASTQRQPPKRLAQLTILAIGVVYGDIGTSPLYAFRECFKPGHGVVPVAANVYGVLSLIVWTLILIVAIKYITFIMRADNQGEGGILALLALLLQRQRKLPEQWRGTIGRIQSVVATAYILALFRNSSSASAGVFQANVFRGLVFSVWATASSSSAVY